jgi:hypothetical protein
MKWIHVGPEKSQWEDLVNVIMNLWVSKNDSCFLEFTVWGTANFSRTTYLVAWCNEEKTFLDELG